MKKKQKKWTESHVRKNKMVIYNQYLNEMSIGGIKKRGVVEGWYLGLYQPPTRVYEKGDKPNVQERKRKK